MSPSSVKTVREPEVRKPVRLIEKRIKELSLAEPLIPSLTGLIITSRERERERERLKPSVHSKLSSY